MKTTTLATVFIGLTLSVASAFSFAAPPTKVDGGILTDTAGMTLYTFDKDEGAKSACVGGCATNWPPLLAQDSDVGGGDYSVITRDDGKKQWTYKGKPLYLFVKDKAAGDKAGDNARNVWHVVKP